MPTLFAYRGQQPLALTPEAQALADRAQPSALWRALMEDGADAGALLEALRQFDALIVLDRKPFALRPTPGLSPIAVEPEFALYRIVH